MGPTAHPDLRGAREMAHHGNTPAAWTGVMVILVGFFVGGLGLVLGEWWMFWIGVVLVVLGPIAGKVLQLLGLGSEPQHQAKV
jgi:hypothetical protein